LEAIAPGVDLEVRLAREHAAHVVVVGLLAEAADVRAGDDVVIAVGRCGVYGENLHLGVALDELLHELLRVSVARRVGLVGVGIEEIRSVRDSTVEPVANALRAVLERAAVEAGVMEVSQAQRSNAIVRYVAEWQSDLEAVASRVEHRRGRSRASRQPAPRTPQTSTPPPTRTH